MWKHGWDDVGESPPAKRHRVDDTVEAGKTDTAGNEPIVDAAPTGTPETSSSYTPSSEAATSDSEHRFPSRSPSSDPMERGIDDSDKSLREDQTLKSVFAFYLPRKPTRNDYLEFNTYILANYHNESNSQKNSATATESELWGKVRFPQYLTLAVWAFTQVGWGIQRSDHRARWQKQYGFALAYPDGIHTLPETGPMARTDLGTASAASGSGQVDNDHSVPRGQYGVKNEEETPSSSDRPMLPRGTRPRSAYTQSAATQDAVQVLTTQARTTSSSPTTSAGPCSCTLARKEASEEELVDRQEQEEREAFSRIPKQTISSTAPTSVNPPSVLTPSLDQQKRADLIRTVVSRLDQTHKAQQFEDRIQGSLESIVKTVNTVADRMGHPTTRTGAPSRSFGNFDAFEAFLSLHEEKQKKWLAKQMNSIKQRDQEHKQQQQESMEQLMVQ